MFVSAVRYCSQSRSILHATRVVKHTRSQRLPGRTRTRVRQWLRGRRRQRSDDADIGTRAAPRHHSGDVSTGWNRRWVDRP